MLRCESLTVFWNSLRALGYSELDLEEFEIGKDCEGQPSVYSCVLRKKEPVDVKKAGISQDAEEFLLCDNCLKRTDGKVLFARPPKPFEPS